MPADALYSQHIKELSRRLDEMLSLFAEKKVLIDAVLIHSGSLKIRYADDHALPFHAYGHFNHWLPIDMPDQALLLAPGEKPRWFRVVRPDYWYDQTIDTPAWIEAEWDIVPLTSPDAIFDHLPSSRRIAFLGENTEFAGRLGMPSGLWNEKNLLNRLDWSRSIKTPYEVARTREANKIALHAHDVARAAFFDGASEFEIHNKYLAACSCLDHDLPYPNIVGINEKSAILHYQNRRKSSPTAPGLVLVDAGYRHWAYAADITRTWVNNFAHPLMHDLAREIEAITGRLIDMCVVGKPYPEIQDAALAEVQSTLVNLGIIVGSADELKSKKIANLFFPHGIGHSLGVQVHDVAGLFKDETGILLPPPEDHKNLRSTRTLLEDMVYTIEPGIYFMPILLDPARTGEKSSLINWDLVDACIPWGGVRWEDDVLISANGPVNLTLTC